MAGARPAVGASRRLAASVALAGTAQASVLVGTFVRAKLLALQGGPSLVGVVAQLSTTISLLVTLCALGISNAGVKELAACDARDDAEGARRAIATVLVLPVVAGAGLTLLAGGLSPWVSPLLFGSGRPLWWLPVAVSTVPASLIGTGVATVLQGLRLMRQLAIATVAATVGGTAVAIPFIVSGSVSAIVISLPVASLTASLVFLLTCRAQLRDLSVRRLLPRARIGSFVRFGIASLSASALTLGGDLAVRVAVVHRLGLTANGLYQPVFLISAAGFALLGNAVATVLLPELSGLISANQRSRARAVLSRASQLSVALTTLVTLLVISFSPTVVTIMASSDFDAASPVLCLQVVGEVPRIFAYTVGAVLLPQERVMAWFSCGAAATVVRLGVTVALLPSMGLDALALSYLLEWVVAAAVATFVLRADRDLRPVRGDLVLVLTGTAACGALAVLARHTSGLVLAVSGLAASVAWAVGTVPRLRRPGRPMSAS